MLEVLVLLDVMQARVGDLFLDGVAHGGGGRGCGAGPGTRVSRRGNRAWAGGAYLWLVHMPGGIVLAQVGRPAIGAYIGRLPLASPSPRPRPFLDRDNLFSRSPAHAPPPAVDQRAERSQVPRSLSLRSVDTVR